MLYDQIQEIFENLRSQPNVNLYILKLLKKSIIKSAFKNIKLIFYNYKIIL